MVYHVLNGDALAQQFPDTLRQDPVIVIREAFMEGPRTTSYSEAYWDKRSEYIEKTFGENKSDYESRVMSQFRVLEKIRNDDHVFLWFEDDLFC
jgi:hypothetical protein